MTTKIYNELRKELSSALRQLNSNFKYNSYDVIVSNGDASNSAVAQLFQEYVLGLVYRYAPDGFSII